jgi:hypothetical protein
LENVQRSVAKFFVVRVPETLKDLGEWVKSGATAADIEAVIQYAEPFESPTEQQSSSKEKSAEADIDYQPSGNTPTGYIEVGICKEDILLGDGYLERGCASLLAGPSGIGKSSIQMQKGCCWACGSSAFDLAPPRPLRVVMVQNEDSRNDLVRQSEVARALSLDPELIRKNFWIETVRGKIGQDAIKIMCWLIKWWKADLLLVNPLSAYHDGDISRNTDNVAFLYGELGELLDQLRIGLDAAHHKGKPPKTQQKPREDVYHEVMYDILGGSVLTNFFRGIMTVSPIANSNIHKFTLAKRFEESQWPTKTQQYKWHEDRSKRLWILASAVEANEAKKTVGKTLHELYTLVPTLGTIPRETLELEASKAGFTRKEYRGLLEQALADSAPDQDRLYQWAIYNPKGLAKAAFSRYEQPVDQTHQAVRDALAKRRKRAKAGED